MDLYLVVTGNLALLLVLPISCKSIIYPCQTEENSLLLHIHVCRNKYIYHYTFLAILYTLTRQKRTSKELAFFHYFLCCQNIFLLKCFLLLFSKLKQFKAVFISYFM